MNKTKIIIAVSAVIVVAALVLSGVKFAGDKATPETTTAPEAVTTLAAQTNLPVSDLPQTTLKPFVDAQTEILTPTTTKAPAASTTEPPEEHATRLDEVNGWNDDKLTEGLPKIRSDSLSTINYISDRGYRTVIRIRNFDYNSYLAYIDRLESEGFSDNNNRKHIPQTAPSTVAMFYSKFDGNRSFGVYWHGAESSADFDCELVICDYDQAK